MLNAYAIYDKKTAKYMSPFFCPNVTTALRGVQTALGEKSNLTLYPGDFALYDLGQFEDSMGVFIPNPNLIPQFVEEIVTLIPKGNSNV